MISTLISSESRYPVDRKKIERKVQEILERFNLQEAEVSVRIVGERKIRQLNQQFRQVDEATDVLSFGLEEPRGNDGILRLGDIVISYPEAQKAASEENKLVDEAVLKLIEHGLFHLLGFEHSEGEGFSDNVTSFKFKIPTAKN